MAIKSLYELMLEQFTAGDYDGKYIGFVLSDGAKWAGSIQSVESGYVVCSELFRVFDIDQPRFQAKPLASKRFPIWTENRITGQNWHLSMEHIMVFGILEEIQ
jgi:hypothetical protein